MNKGCDLSMGKGWKNKGWKDKGWKNKGKKNKGKKRKWTISTKQWQKAPLASNGFVDGYDLLTCSVTIYQCRFL